MGVTDKVWTALTAMVKLEDKVNRQSEAMKSLQCPQRQRRRRSLRLFHSDQGGGKGGEQR